MLMSSRKEHSDTEKKLSLLKPSSNLAASSILKNEEVSDAAQQLPGAIRVLSHDN